MKSQLEEQLYFQIKACRLPLPERQYRFIPGRRYTADFAWLGPMLIVEVQGGSYVFGRHNRPQGFEADCERTCIAMSLGWRIMPVTGKMVKDGRALKYLEGMLK